jgi:hypothetical protein
MHDTAPDAELLLAPGCPHCPAVLEALAGMVKEGRIAQLAVINIAQRPEAAQARGVRGVPWTRIGPLELPGAYTPAELRQWAARANDRGAQATYLSEQLASGALDSVIAACRRHPELLPALLDLAADLDTPYAVRIGVGAVLEDLAADRMLTTADEQMIGLSRDPNAALRADAAHYLGLVGSDAARNRLRELLDDDDAEVREIASESLAASGD